MPHLRSKAFATSGDVRTFPNGRTEIVRFDESIIGRGIYEPGFRWSADLADLAGTPICQVHHQGYAVSGTLRVETDDGQTLDINAGSIFEIPPGHDAWVLGDEPVVLIDWTTARTFRLAPADREEVVATVLFTDIVHSTETVHRLGDRVWHELLKTHNARLRDELNQFRGRQMETTGDGILAVFDSPSRAVRCAAAMVRAARAIDLAIRVGIHTGEIEFVGENPHGLALHAAARMVSLGDAGDVTVSSTTRDLLEGSALEFEDAGGHRLKGLPGVRKAFRLANVDTT